MTMAQQQPLSFDLDESMLKTIGQEFDVQELTDKFAGAVAGKSGESIEKVAQEIFGEYGRGLMKRSLELGEEYMDRTYEILKMTIDKTGTMYFPLVPQRFIEIAYLSTQPIFTMHIIQNNGQKLAYRIPICDTFAAVTAKCGQEVANSLPCRHACLAALETLFQDMDFKVAIMMEAMMPKNQYCQFAATKI